MTNDEIIRNLILESRTAAPGRLSELAVELSSWYATLSDEYGSIEIFYADRWLDLRKGEKSDKMADRKWAATEEGKRMTTLRLQLKYIEKVVSTIKLRLKTKISEGYNAF